MTCLDELFSNRSKFSVLQEDPTMTCLATLQSYLLNLKNRNEISEEIYNNIRLRNAIIARAHGLPKVHKQYDRIPPFRPIIDTTNSTHYHVGKYISKMLNPLTLNDYSLKDTFDAANRIKSIPRDLLNNNEYALISLDVVSLFTTFLSKELLILFWIASTNRNY